MAKEERKFAQQRYTLGPINVSNLVNTRTILDQTKLTLLKKQLHFLIANDIISTFELTFTKGTPDKMELNLVKYFPIPMEDTESYNKARKNKFLEGLTITKPSSSIPYTFPANITDTSPIIEKKLLENLPLGTVASDGNALDPSSQNVGSAYSVLGLGTEAQIIALLILICQYQTTHFHNGPRVKSVTTVSASNYNLVFDDDKLIENLTESAGTITVLPNEANYAGEYKLDAAKKIVESVTYANPVTGRDDIVITYKTSGGDETRSINGDSSGVKLAEDIDIENIVLPHRLEYKFDYYLMDDIPLNILFDKLLEKIPDNGKDIIFNTYNMSTNKLYGNMLGEELLNKVKLGQGGNFTTIESSKILYKLETKNIIENAGSVNPLQKLTAMSAANAPTVEDKTEAIEKMQEIVDLYNNILNQIRRKKKDHEKKILNLEAHGYDPITLTFDPSTGKVSNAPALKLAYKITSSAIQTKLDGAVATQIIRTTPKAGPLVSTNAKAVVVDSTFDVTTTTTTDFKPIEIYISGVTEEDNLKKGDKLELNFDKKVEIEITEDVKDLDYEKHSEILTEKEHIAKCNGGIKLASFYLKKFNTLIEKLREFVPNPTNSPAPTFDATKITDAKIDTPDFTVIVTGILSLLDDGATKILFSDAVTKVEDSSVASEVDLKKNRVVRGQVILRIPVGYDTLLKNNINIHRHPSANPGSNTTGTGFQTGLSFNPGQWIKEPYLTDYCEEETYFEEKGHPNTRDLVAKIAIGNKGAPKPKYITSVELQSGPYTYDSKLDDASGTSTFEPLYTQEIMGGGARRSRKQYTYVRKNSMKNKRARGSGSKRRQRNVQRTQMRKNRYRLRK